ncbi:MAG: molybdopterin-guanine dinucleotide biosynthesis protein B [Dehalococcoidia bacterium]
MPPTVCIVGKSETGKTTLLEKLIPELKGRGHRIATIKHQAGGFDLDIPGKDSWRHAQAGSECVILSSTERVAVIQQTDHEMSLADLAQFIPWDCDLVLVEGFKKGKASKIEVHRKGSGELALFPQELLAVVTDEELDLDERAPQYSHDDISGLADLIEDKILSSQAEEVSVFADGKAIPVKQYVADLFANIVYDMVSSLKGAESPKNMSISIRKR